MLFAALVCELGLYVREASVHDHDLLLGPERVALHREVRTALPALLAVADYLVVAREQALAGVKHVQGDVDRAPQTAVHAEVRVADVHYDCARVVFDLSGVNVADGYL